jgi:hypothetical protein
MIYDLITADPELLKLLVERSADGSITIASTQIQEDQLAALPDASKRQLFDAIPRQVIPTAGAVWDVSKWDMACWGDGPGAVKIADIFKGNPSDIPDALIGVTTAAVDKLVTCDRRLKTRLEAVDPSVVWSFEQFAAHLRG